MRAEDLLNYVRAASFQPFRIVVNSGKVYHIRHPEMIRVLRTTFHVYFVRADEPPDAPADRVDMVSLLLIERVGYIEATTAV